MPKRFLAISLFAALVALPATVAAASAPKKASTQVKSTNLAYGAKRVHDWTRPKATIKRAVGQRNPTSQSAVRFTVSFSEPVHGFTAADVRLSGTARVGKAKVASLSNRKTFRVTVAGMTRPGFIVATVRAGAARDAAGNLSTAGNRIKVRTVAGKSRETKRPVPSQPPATTPTSSPPASSPPSSSPPASPPGSSGLIVGTVVNAAGGGSSALDPALTAGVRWVREEIWWPTVEQNQGTLDWSGSDSLFLNAAEKGVQILPLVGGIPSWAGASDKTMPSDPSGFATFVAQVTARYGPGGAFWQAHSSLSQYAPVNFEIWNEPWLPSSSDPVDPARYARLFKAAAIAGRAANPAARFIVAAEWQYHASDGSWRNWVDDMYAAVPDLNSYFDAYSTHPYGNGSVDNWTPGNGDASEARRLEVVHDDFVARGAGDKKMWVTEMGWSTCSGGDNCYSEAEQKQDLARFDELARTSWSSFMAATFYYRLTDLNGSDRTNRELWYGLIRADGSFKPAYDTLRTIAAIGA
jgi:polysaccharide biosynthesis protein PslG